MRINMIEIPRLIFRMSFRTESLTSGTKLAGSPDWSLLPATTEPRSSAAKNIVGTRIPSRLRREINGYNSDVPREDKPCHEEGVIQVKLWRELLFVNLGALHEERNSWNE